MFANTWTYLFLLLGFGFLNSIAFFRHRKTLFVLALNVTVYALIDVSLLPAFFAYAAVAYFFALLVKDEKFSSSFGIGVMVMVLISLALFIVGKIIPMQKINSEIVVRLLVPLGFSYVALQSIAFVVNARENRQNFPDLLEFLASSMFFANILSGPIADLYRVRQDILQNRVTDDDVREGVLRIVNGFCKKSVADFVTFVFIFPSAYATGIAAGNIAFIPALLLKFYLDFSGYTDMAIGGAKLLGVHLPENFDRPYSSVTMADYWNRWHMTLGGWFKKYFFYPLQLWIFRRLKVREWVQVFFVNIALFLTFVAIGLWHGLTFKFFLWGVFNAGLVVLSNKMIRLKVHLPARLGFWFFNLLTLFLVAVGQLLLLSDSTDKFFSNLSDIFSANKNSSPVFISALILSAVLFLQHRLDGRIRDGFFRKRNLYLILIFCQILISIFFHRAGGVFLYAEF